MTIDSNYVTTRPLWNDEAIRFGYFWLDKVNEYAKSRGYNVTDLETELAKLALFENAIRTQNPSFFHGFGHGNEDVFSGQRQEILLQRNVNDSLMGGRITYLCSCLTGVRLGPSIITKGGKAYAGYDELFSFDELFPPPGVEWDISCGRYHWSWMDFTNVLANAVLAGKPLTEACGLAVERANAWIDFWSISTDYMASEIISLLIVDRNALVCLQDGSITPPVVESVHPRIAFAIGVSGSYIFAGDTPTITIGVSCQVSKCDFRGVRFRILDDLGNLVYAGTIVNYLNGVNWSTVSFTVPRTTEIGIHKWSIIIEADGVHLETTGYLWIWVKGGGVIHGYALDGLTKAPIADARIVVMGGTYPPIYYPARTDANGHYILKNIPEGITYVTGDKSGYYQFASNMQVFPDDINRLDLKFEQVQSVNGNVCFVCRVIAIAGNFVSNLPVKGVKITLTGIGEAYTDVYGQAVFRDVVPGTYQCTAEKYGCTFRPISPITVVSAIQILPSLGMTSVRSIFARVFDAETLQPILGAKVTCEYYDATTDEEGYIEFVDIIYPYTYHVTASKEGYASEIKIVDASPTSKYGGYYNLVSFYLRVGVSQHKLTVTSSPIAGVPVTVDAVPSGFTPTSATVMEGEHTISVPAEVET